MTISDFVANYNMHDSLIDSVEILKGGSTIIFWIDFAFWMQNGYDESDPETGTLKVAFFDVMDCVIPEDVSWDEISILGMNTDGEYLTFALINDMTDDYLEIKIKANQVSVEALENMA